MLPSDGSWGEYYPVLQTWKSIPARELKGTAWLLEHSTQGIYSRGKTPISKHIRIESLGPTQIAP